MNAKSPVRIVVDNSIFSLSDTMQGFLKECEVTILDTPHKCKVLAYERRPPLKPTEAWKTDQLACLPTVARLAREGRLRMYTSPELCLEALKRPCSYPANLIGRLFDDISIEKVETPIERSRYFQLPRDEYISKECMVRFCKWLLKIDGDRVASWDRIKAVCTPFELNNLRGLERFRELCKGLGVGQYPDAFHLWTSELHGMKFFLTTDRRFIRAITHNRKLSLPCIPTSPTELLDSIGVLEREPFPYQYGETIGVFGQRF